MIYVVKFSSKTSTRIWVSQYGDLNDTEDIDEPTSAELSANGKLIIQGTIGRFSTRQKVTLEFDSQTGTITVL